MASARLVGTAMIFCAAIVADDSAECSARQHAALGLKAGLEKAGMTVHVGLDVRTSPNGLGVFVTEAVDEGAPIFTLPVDLMLRGNGTTTSLIAAILRARQYAQTAAEADVLRLYMATLPVACPPNLVMASEADLALVRSSMHKWKADLVAEAISGAALPKTMEADRRWAACMLLSRSLLHTDGPAMMPFVDLLNHGNSTDHKSTADAHTVIAQRRLRPGDELTFPYVASPSKARLLTSFGFDQGAPSLSLLADGLPKRDEAWLQSHGCAGPRLTELFVETDGHVSEDGMRQALKCVRLKLFEPAEAAFAIDSGYLQTWGGNDAVRAADKDGLLGSILKKDALIVKNTASMCTQALTQEMIAEQQALFPAASPRLRAAIREESIAVMDCYALLSAAHEEITASAAQI